MFKFNFFGKNKTNYDLSDLQENETKTENSPKESKQHKIDNYKFEKLIRNFNRQEINEEEFINSIREIKDEIIVIRKFKVDIPIKDNVIKKGSKLTELMWYENQNQKRVCFTSFEKAEENKLDFDTIIQTGLLINILKDCIQDNLALKINLNGLESVTLYPSAMIKLFSTQNDNINIDSNNSRFSQSKNTNMKFSMKIENVFSFKTGECVVVGHISTGTISVNDSVNTLGVNNKTITAKVLRIEKFRKEVSFAESGDAVGIVLSNVTKRDLKVGEYLTKNNV